MTTPLHVSPKCGHLETTKTLVERCAVINNTNKYGNTLIKLDAYNGILEIFPYLKEIIPNIIIRNANKITLLHWAISIREA